MARPTKFTPGRIAAILMTLRGGATRTAAAATAGIDYSTMQDWVNHDPVLTLAEDISLPNLEAPGALPDDVYEKGSRFPECLTRAEGEAEAYLVSRIRKAGAEGAKVTYIYDRQGNLLREVHEYDWRANAYLLDHNPKLRKNWLPKTGVEVSGPDGAPISTEGKATVEFKPTPEYLAQLARLADEVMPDEPQGEDDPG